MNACMIVSSISGASYSFLKSVSSICSLMKCLNLGFIVFVFISPIFYFFLKVVLVNFLYGR